MMTWENLRNFTLILLLLAQSISLGVLIEKNKKLRNQFNWSMAGWEACQEKVENGNR